MLGRLLGGRRKFQLETQRMILRLPEHHDFRQWTALRETSASFLIPWEPVWSHDHLTRRNFTGRVQWAARVHGRQSGLPLFLIRRNDQQLLGAITLDNIRRGPAQAGTIGYWIGQPFARQGYMREAIEALPGVASVAVSYRDGSAEVVWSGQPNDAAVADAVAEFGYSATPLR